MESEEYELKNENGIISAPDYPFEYPKNGFGWLIVNACDQYANNTFQECPYTNESCTFQQHKQRSLTFAANLQRQFHIKQGDVVMTCMKNSLVNTLPISAAFYLGALTTSLDPTLSSMDGSHMMSIAEPKMIILDEENLDLIQTSLKEVCKSISLIINETGKKCFDLAVLEKSVQSKCSTLREMLVEDEATKLFRPVIVSDLNTPAVIVFSSGTTGLAKGICLSQKSVIDGGIRFYTMMFKPKVFLHITTMYWISGLLLYCSQFIEGSTRIGMRLFDPELFCKNIESFKIESILLGNSFITTFLGIQKFTQKYDISTVKTILLGGTIATSAHYKLLIKTFPNIYFSNPYGMTETSGPISSYIKSFVKRFETNVGSIGVPFHGVEMKVVDEDTERVLGPNEHGEIRIRCGSNLIGYYNNTIEQPKDTDGFVKSGDLGYYNEQFNFYVTGRSKDMFKFQSWRIEPAAIESVIKQHPAVEEALVFGIPHEDHEFLPTAAVILWDTYLRTDPQEIADFVAKRVSERHRLVGGIYVVDEFPKTTTGKFNRRKLQEIMLKRITK